MLTVAAFRRYRHRVGTEIRVTLPGQSGSADARRALQVLEKLLTLLGCLEDEAVHERASRGSERTTWAFTQLQLGSVVTTLAPNRPRPGVTTATLDDVAVWAIDGL